MRMVNFGVPEQSGITPAVMGFVSRAAAEGWLTGDDLLRLAKGGDTRTSFEDAAGILGKDRVLGHAEVAEAWGAPVLTGPSVEIRYSAETLQWAARENKRGAHWMLGFSRASGLLEQYRTKTSLFSAARGAWLADMDGLPSTFVPGYYLVDFHGRFGKTTWSDQETAIDRMGPQFVRANESVVVGMALSMKMIQGREPLADHQHWGCSTDIHGGRIAVGRTSVGCGMEVMFIHPQTRVYPVLRACVMVKPGA